MVCPDTAPNADPEVKLHPFQVIVACDENGGIGKDGSIPWKAPEDMKRFKTLTSPAATKPGVPATAATAVIMGRKTYDSLPAAFRPLPNRVNIVVSSQTSAALGYPEDVAVVASIDEALGSLWKDATTYSPILSPADGDAAEDNKAPHPKKLPVSKVWVIGGGQLYSECLKPSLKKFCQSVHITRIHTETECDVRLDAAFHSTEAFEKMGFRRETSQTTDEEGNPLTATVASQSVPMAFETWWQYNAEEAQYLALCREIIDQGAVKGDRTGTGTRSVFGRQMRFSLRNGQFPLLTTKRVFWKGVCEELLWFIRGNTNGKDLSAKGVHIWDANGSREFLDQRGLRNNAEGDLGPVYGFQWRHFGAEYKTCHDDYTGEGVDQLKEVISLLRSNPNDRRILMSAWNPAAIPGMALPPCHVLAQFYVGANKELSCMLYQRSCDMGLGVPFNIASYALLTVLLAKACNLNLGDFVHTLGDAHVYSNHVEALQQQLERTPRAFPYIRVNTDREHLEDYELSDFDIVGYSPYPIIKMDMAV